MKAVWALAAAVLIAVGSFAFFLHEHPGCALFFHRAAAPDRMGKVPPNGMEAFIVSMGSNGKFGATDKQKAELREIVFQMNGRLLSLKLSEAKERIEIAQLLMRDNPPKDAIAGELGAILKLKGEEQSELLDSFYKIREVLTPDQRRVFSRFLAKRLVGNRFGIRPEMNPRP